MASEWEANLLVHRLEDEGVRASATGGYTAGFIAEAPGAVGIFVDSRDETRARGIIRGYFEEKKLRAQVSLDVQSREQTADGDGRATNAFEKPLSQTDFWIWLLLLVNLFGLIVAFWASLPPIAFIGLTVLGMGSLYWFRRMFV